MPDVALDSGRGADPAPKGTGVNGDEPNVAEPAPKGVGALEGMVENVEGNGEVDPEAENGEKEEGAESEKPIGDGLPKPDRAGAS